MNQRKAKRIRSEMRENLQDPYFSEVPGFILDSAVKSATRKAKDFYNNLTKKKRHKFEITQ